MKSRRGFYLIELLVVILIIAGLASLIFPVFAQAKERARQVSCFSNQKQIGLAIMMYAQDNDETYPLNNFKVVRGNPQTVHVWMEGVSPYIKAGSAYGEQGGIWHCPNSQRKFYCINDAVAHDAPWDGNPGASGQSATLAALSSPSDLILLAETGENGSATAPDWRWGFFVSDPYWATRSCDPTSRTWTASCGNKIAPAHFGRAAVTFADGHTKSISRQKIEEKNLLP